MAKSTWLSRQILNHALRSGTWTKSTFLYVLLASADLTDAFITANELTIGTGGYARAQIDVADSDWLAPATVGGREVCVNAELINFGTATANLNGGSAVGWWGIADAATGGNLWWHGPISLPRTILTGDPITIAIGAMTVAEG